MCDRDISLQRDLLEQHVGISKGEANALMALMCLSHMMREPRLILKPWLHFHEFQLMEDEFPLHSYIVSFWQEHCLAAQGVALEVSESLDFVISHAWAAEREAEAQLDPDPDSRELDLLVRNEGLDVGLVLAQAYNLPDLEDFYTQMGADIDDSGPFVECTCSSICSGDNMQDVVDLEPSHQSQPRCNNVWEDRSLTPPSQSQFTLPIRSSAPSSAGATTHRQTLNLARPNDEGWHSIEPSDYT